MGFLSHIEIWGDVKDPAMDEITAPSLGMLALGRDDRYRIYADPIEFFSRTYLTSDMVDVLEIVTRALMGKSESKIVLLLSLFGGGKTHTLITIYHALRDPEAIRLASFEERDRDRVERVVNMLKDLKKMGVSTVVIDGQVDRTVPDPASPLDAPGYRINTLWGYIAHMIGRYGDMRSFDEMRRPPGSDTLADMFGKTPILILVDELAHYVAKLRNSSDERIIGYSKQVVEFVESLAVAISRSQNACLVVSLPIEVDKEGERVEKRYEAARGVVLELYRVFERLSPRKILPVSQRELEKVLRVRIFKKVDMTAARRVASLLSNIYGREEYEKIFGQEARNIVDRIETSYPFHPIYIDTLANIINIHEGLEKTRSAINITRKVVRSLITRGEDPELIMPFHIDVESKEIQALLFSTESYRQYSAAVEEDIVKRIQRYEKPELGRAIAKTVLITTFVYGGLPRSRQLYPDDRRVVLASYEPSMGNKLGVYPKDYIDALSWLSKHLIYMVSDGNRYWFTQIQSPVKMIKDLAEHVDDIKALEKANKLANKLLHNKPQGRRGREEGEAKPQLFRKAFVIRKPEPIPYDEREYILLAMLSTARDEEIRRMIFETDRGSSRSHANTIYVVYPRDDKSLSQIIEKAKELVACEEVEKQVEELYAGADKDTLDVLKKKINSYCWGADGVEGDLEKNIVEYLNTIAYPSYDSNKGMNTIEITTKSFSIDSIVAGVERTLRQAQPRKIYDSMDFDTLSYLLQDIGVDLSKGKKISDIVSYFYTNPRLPAVLPETIKRAIEDGLARMEIGIRRRDRIYYTKILSTGECPSMPEAESIKVEDSDEVLPWTEALREMLNSLTDKKETTPEGVKITRHVICIDSVKVPVSDALAKYPLEALRRPVLRIVEIQPEGVEIQLDREEIDALPGEKLSIKVRLARVGSFSGSVRIDVDGGSLDKSNIVLSDTNQADEVIWSIEAPKILGTHRFKITATPQTGVAREKELRVNVKSREMVEGVPSKGAKISAIKIAVEGGESLKPIGIARKYLDNQAIVSNASIALILSDDRSSEIEFRVKNIGIKEVESALAQIVLALRPLIRDIKGELVISPRNREYIEFPDIAEGDKAVLEKLLRYQPYM